LHGLLSMDFVVDANVLGEVCRNNKKAVELLSKMRNHRVVFCKEIFNEYKALPKKEFCKNPTVVEEWIIGLVTRSSYGKKIQISEGITPCFSRLIKRGKFKKKDMVYINTVQKTNEKLLIAFEWHFINAERCISELKIERLDLEEALNIME
jgi:hypothetical protein